MPHPRLDNRTPYVAEPIFYDDEDGDPTMVLVAKATFEIQAHGLVLTEEQPGLEPAGQSYGRDPGTSCYRLEPEIAPFKLCTDVVALGHACAPRVGTTCVEVGLQVGSLRKLARVLGDRLWHRSMGEFEMTPPQAFERIPLTFERAFGGWDRSPARSDRHSFEPRNPAGRGFHSSHATESDSDYAPNIEDPREPIRTFWDRPQPVAFGFTSPHWTPRASFAGTYDRAWEDRRKPLLPVDFDPRFYSAAPPGLIASGYLRGDEAVQAMGFRPEGQTSFHLPSLPPPRVQVALKGLPDPQLDPKLDTVILDFDQLRVTLFWRCRTKLATGPHDVDEITVSSPEALSFPRSYTEPTPGQAAAN